jgi:hypothetical protein
MAVPESVWSGEFLLFGVKVRGHVLSDGQRIIEADDVVRLLNAMAGNWSTDPGDLERFARWQRGETV